MKENTAFVVGCPRSGTSPFARWLHACGLTTLADERRNERHPSSSFEQLLMPMSHRVLERPPRGGDYRIATEPHLTNETLEHPVVVHTFELAFQPVLRNEVGW